MPSNAVEKFLARASGRSSVKPGEIVHPEPELVIVHDGYVAPAKKELDRLGVSELFDASRVMLVTDHEVLYSSAAAAGTGRQIRIAAEAWKTGMFFDIGQGGHGHIFPMEAGYVRPGMFLFSYDMHCTNFGAVGALALRCGSEITTVLATGTLWTMVPHCVRVELAGRLPTGVMARDVGFRLANDLVSGRHGVDPDYLAIEMTGPGLETLSLDERVALCNTVTEIGVCAIYFPPDAGILEWARSRARGRVEGVYPDPGARYLANIRIDLSSFEPQVALPGAPENAADLASVVGTKIDHAYIGSCGSGMWGDLETAVRILAGRRVASGVRLFVVPGTEASAQRLAREGHLATLLQAGALVLPSGCGPCAGGVSGALAEGEVSISTAAVNTPGRMGAKGADIYLASPATVAASAVAGAIADPRSYL